ncbi:MAG: VWA domain-containing protein [Candidatus Omnitrophica bacterium]|nr:VWA domain-containing protein [Candidatus Omnitrophota bacterium]
MQFVSKAYFNLFFFIPVLVFFFSVVGMIKHRRSVAFAKAGALKKISYNHSRGRDFTRGLLMVLALIFIIIALAQPQWGKEQVEIKHLGVDIMFLLDTSTSMLAEDVLPSRITKAKLEIEGLLDRLKGNRVGLIAFAGSSYLECPLTIDYSAFRLFLNAVNVGFIPDPGTVLSDAINRASRTLGEKGSKSKAMIILSDGEDHEGGITEAIGRAKKMGIRIYSIGVGRKQGEPIPLKDQYGVLKGHKKDRTGAVILTKLQDEDLNQAAQYTGGLYYPASNAEKEIDAIAQHINNLEKEEFGSRLLTQREAKYHIFLVIALILLIIEYMIGERRRGAALRYTSQAAAIVIFGLLNMGISNEFSKEIWTGNEYYREGTYDKAIEEYKKGQIKEPDSDSLVYNMGNAYYSSEDFDAAKKAYKQALTMSHDDQSQKSAILYNLGNAQYRLGEVDQAIESYKRALDINENDEDAKFNLEYLLKKKALMDQQNKQQKPDQKENRDQQQNQDEHDQDKQGDKEKKDEQQDEQQQEQQQNKQGEEDQEKQEQEDAEEDKDQEQEDASQEEQQGANSDQEQSSEEQDRRQQDQEQPQQQEPEEGNEQQGSEQESEQFGDNEQEADVEPQQEEYEAPDHAQAAEQQQRSGGISEEEAKRILNALQEAEKELGNVRDQSPRAPEYKEQEKDW